MRFDITLLVKCELHLLGVIGQLIANCLWMLLCQQMANCLCWCHNVSKLGIVCGCYSVSK